MNDPAATPGAVFYRERPTVLKHVLYGVVLTVGIAVHFWYRDLVASDLAPSLATVPGVSIPLAESIVAWTLLLVVVSAGPLLVASTAFLLYRRANPVPALVIDEDGFTDRTSLTELGRVSWTNVEHLEVVEQMNVPQLRVTFDDPDRVVADRGPLKAWHLRFTQRMMADDGAVALHQFDASVEDVVSAIERYSGPTVDR